MNKIEAMLSNGVDLGVTPSKALKFLDEEASKRETIGQETEPRRYTREYQLDEELGHGVWSTVYRASEVDKPPIPAIAILPPSPPTSPPSKPLASKNKTLAVKKPSRRDAHSILRKEAGVLTYLHFHTEAPTYLVPFFGFDAAQHSIVLEAVPLSLDLYTRSIPKTPLRTKTMFDPVVGAEEWAHLADNLISGLAFLHEQCCVHGDIKPGNILLRHDSSGACKPLYCDFSSSHIVSSAVPPEKIEEVSAVTTDYTAPELLESFYHRNDDRAIATFASDVFALAVTLLFAAIGESPYAGAHMEIQKMGMAKEGLPLEFARRGEQASRVMKGKVVAKALGGGVEKSVENRLAVGEWQGHVQEAIKSWKQGR